MIDLDYFPNDPGCYLFKDKHDHVIYVGKARDLRKRVKSYFQKNDSDPKTRSLVENIDSIDFIVTDNEVEALILENNLIKRNQPKYNIDLKDSKNYAYLQLTAERFPRLLLARRKTGKGSFFGPFVSARERDNVRYVLNKTLQLRTCRRLPKRTCLRYQINLCSAPCIKGISEEEYESKVDKARLVLSGRIDKLIKILEKEMAESSRKKNYERALELREQMSAVLGLAERQKMDRQRKHDEDIINFLVRDNRVYLALFNVYKGTLKNKEEYTFDRTPDFLEEFMVQYYSEKDVPKEIILPEKIDPSLSDFLENIRSSQVKITVPKRGEKKKLLELVRKNIEISFFGDTSKLEALQKELNLEETPLVIECFDISHISGTSTVGSMVQYRNARPDKSNYRRFRIKSFNGIDDTAALSEVVRRRYSRLIKEDGELPNLILIDGGRGQLNSSVRALEKMGLRIPVAAIAKRLEEVYLPDRPVPIRIDRKNKGLHFIQEMRDEAHWFAIKYNRLLRKKEVMG